MSHTQKTFYVTTPIYYVNAEPHIGSLYSTILADVIARYMRVCGKKTYFVTGLDEHGQKVSEAAEKAHIAPQKFVDSLVPAFKNAWTSWDIAYDFFVRTTDHVHVKAVQEWIRDLRAQNIIYKSTYEGWYSVSSEAFLTDKDIEIKDVDGTPLCPLSGKRALWLVQEAYFFRLSAYEKQLLEFYKTHPHFVEPSERMHEVVAFVEQGLKDLCISRSKKSLNWGIPFPDDSEHVVYVWADALNNYLTAVGYLQPEKKDLFNAFWPCDVHVMGKDILRFHAIYWPAFLMASQLPLPQTLLVHGWILIDEQKMSKSLGNAIQPAVLLEKYGLDRCRYYFVRHMAITHDVSFNYSDLEEKTNAELSNAFGNLVQRVLVMAHSYECIELNGPYKWTESEEHLYALEQNMLKNVQNEMKCYLLHRAYAHVWEYIGILNAYIHQQQPWVIAKHDRERVKIILAALIHGIWTVGVILWPVMPSSMIRLFELLGVHVEAHVPVTLDKIVQPWQHSFSLKKTELLFPRYEKVELEVVAQKVSESKMKNEEAKNIEKNNNDITIDELMKVELRVGTITAVEEIPKAEKLYALTVDFGSHDIRTICAGIKQHYASLDLIGIRTVFAYNLQPRILRGIQSYGMTMMAQDKNGIPTFIKISESVENGTILR